MVNSEELLICVGLASDFFLSVFSVETWLWNGLEKVWTVWMV